MTSILPILLDASIRSSAVALLVGAVIWLARVHSSSLRHKAWLGVLGAMLFMPILPRVTPRIEVPVYSQRVRGPRAQAPDSFDSGQAGVTLPRLDRSAPAAASVLPPATPTARSGYAIPAWPGLIAGGYAIVAAILLFRLFAGWLFARRLAASSKPISVRNMTVYESSGIATPITVGLRSPRIMFPADWTGWPDDKLTAVLAHEAAHVRRRDTVTSFFAHLNQCIFWFHPLAWWLQRQLSLDAEQDCDDAGVLAVGGNRKYTEVLLDIAQTAQRRPAFHGVGVDGSGLLGPRIDRLLRGDVGRRPTLAQRAVLATTCAVVVFVGAACHQKTVAELKPDPSIVEQIAKSRAHSDLFQAVNKMTASDAASLEAAIRQNPEDLAARKKLMTFYEIKGREVLGDATTSKNFWASKLWCIEHHPENECASMGEPLFDAAAYQQGGKLWEAVLRRGDVTADEQMAAAQYFMRADPQRAEALAERASIPDGRRAAFRGRIYAAALTGPAAQSPYGQEVRKKLDESNDAALLASVGFVLAQPGIPESPTMALGQRYLSRSEQIDPNSHARGDLARLREIDAQQKFYKDLDSAVGRQASEEQYQKAAGLAASERVRFLPYLAEHAYWEGALKSDNHDGEGARKAWDLARRYSKDTLTLAEEFRNDPDHGNRVYMANSVLAILAMRADGNSKEARKYLLAASTQRTTNNTWFPTTLKLLVLLLRYGNADDREAVIKFLETYGKTVNRPDINLVAAAEKLRKGVMPSWYQYEVDQLK